MAKVSLELLKYISAGIIWITTLLGNAMPMCIRAIKWQSRLEALAGGVFLGAGLAHLLADSFEELGDKINYPLAPAVAISTFVLLTAVELFSYGEHDEEFQIGEGHHHHQHFHDKNVPPSSLEDNLLVSNPIEEKVPEMFGETNSNLTVPMISLYIIMDIHSVIEGLALGIMKTMDGVIAIFCPIVGHKPVEAFALSLIILKDRPKKWLFWFFVIVYTLMTPAGLIAGIIITKLVENQIVMGVIAAFSAGTFLFVGCHEWAEMFEHKTEWNCAEKTWHFMMFLIGVLCMLSIAIVETLNPEDK